MTTKLMTIDEAQRAVARSALRIVQRAHTTVPFEISTMLWGAGEQPGLDLHDQILARRHRQLLDDTIELGYAGVVTDQLDGIASAARLDVGRFERFSSDAA